MAAARWNVTGPRLPASRSDPRDARITRIMRVLMLSWEYPPVVVGGLGRHVHALATRLAEQSNRVNLYEALGGGWQEQTARSANP